MRARHLTALAVLVTAAACGSHPLVPAAAPTSSVVATTTTTAAPAPAPTTLPRALVASGRSLALVAADRTEPAWIAPDARAALDGSAVFRVDAGALVRVDVHTGSPAGRWALPAGAWEVAVVAARGRRVVLTDGVIDGAIPVATTRLAVVDVERNEPARVLTLPGTLEPEAMSVDGGRIFVLDHRPSYYRVRTVEVATGDLNDVYGRDKEPPEDMVGDAVRAVLSPDGTVLATLYREPSGQHPFVHVLHLANGWAYCADLPVGRYDAIAASADGLTVYTGAVGGSWVAIDVSTFGEPSQDPLPVTTHRTGAPPVPLARAGTAVAGVTTVTADASGLTWWRAGAEVGRAKRSIDRLIALVPG